MWIDYLPDFLKWREFDIYATIVESLQDKTLPEEYIPEYNHFRIEFKNRTESEEQIVLILKNLKKCFKRY